MSSIDQLVIENVKRLRSARGWSQSKLGAVAREVGLDWGRGHVAALENSARRLYLDEIVALMAIFGVSWDELVRTDSAKIEITPALSCAGSELPKVFGGTKRPELQRNAELPPPKHKFTPHEYRAASKLTKSLGLQIRASDIVASALVLWGRSYDEERDHRAAVRAPSDATDRVMQALRAHVSRALYAELRQQIEFVRSCHGRAATA